MWQVVLMINGYFISILGAAMLVVAGYDMFITSTTWSPFLNSSLFCWFIGLSLFLSNRTTIENISIRQGYLMTVVSWVVMPVLSAIPFMLYGSTDNFHDALFEAMSGLSTTGATILTNIEAQPKAILLWRSVLTVIGGAGIVMFAVALLPFLGIGGMQMFQRENSDFTDKFMPKFHYIAKRIFFVYFFLCSLCAVCLYWAGMGWFDAINHAMSTISTAGFSTKNTSILYYDNAAVEAVISVFMIVGALPMTFYIVLLQNKFRHSLRTEQVISFLKVLFVYILGSSLWLVHKDIYNFWTALRYTSFNIISIVTSTGLTSINYLNWGVLFQTLFIIFALTGGCTGSTSGSVKIFRWQVVWAYLKQSMVTAVDANRIVPIKVKQFTISPSAVSSVMVFVVAFFITIFAASMALAFLGVDFVTAFSAVVACATNSGPGVVPSIGPDGNFAWFSDGAKDILSATMLLGRLEVLTVLVVFTRNFWRK